MEDRVLTREDAILAISNMIDWEDELKSNLISHIEDIEDITSYIYYQKNHHLYTYDVYFEYKLTNEGFRLIHNVEGLGKLNPLKCDSCSTQENVVKYIMLEGEYVFTDKITPIRRQDLCMECLNKKY